MSYRPKIKNNASGSLTDFPLDAETVKGVDVVSTKQDKSNLVTVFQSTPDNTHYPSEKLVYDKLNDVVEIAEGKTNNYVISYSTTGTDVVNSSFNSTAATIVINNTEGGYVATKRIKTVTNQLVGISSLKVGDIVSVIETDVPDRWVGSAVDNVYTFYPLETKLNMDTTPTESSTKPITSGGVYTALGDKQDTIDSNHKLDSDLVNDTNQSNKFVSATEKSNINKSLYHLGAFDSEDGKTRQTWEIDLSKLSWSVYSEDNTTRIANIDLNIYSPFAYITSNNYTCGYSNGTLFVNVGTTDTNVNPTGILQYKLATSYTENIIENESILPLDSNMANKIRQKVVDGLNLFAGIVVQGVWLDSSPFNRQSNNTRCSSENEFNVLPNTTYTISNSGGKRVVVQEFQNYRNAINFYDSGWQTGGTYTFTTHSTTTIVRFSFSNDDSSNLTPSQVGNVMFNKGTHIYQHSDFNQKEHITNDEATLLKNEEERCRNLLINPFTNAQTIKNISYTIDGSIITIETTDSSDPYVYFKNCFTLDKETTVTLSLDNSNNIQMFGIVANETTSFIGGAGVSFVTRTLPAGTYGIGFETYNVGTNVYKVMLNYGSNAKSYQKGYGKIMHEADVQAIQGAIAYTDRNNNFTSKQTITSSSEDTPLKLKGNSNSVCDIQFVAKNDNALSWLSAHNDGYLYDFRNGAYHRLAEIDDVNTKLDKLTYEYNFQNTLAGSESYLYIGDFPMYDSNLTIEITSTTSVSKYGVLVLATQNINTSRGGVWNAYVYGDSDNRLCSNLYIQYSSGSNNFKVYLNGEGYSKNTIHIRGVALAGEPTIRMTSVSSLPSTDLISIFNRLNDNFLKLSGGTIDGNLDVNGTGNFSGTLYATGGVNGIVVKNASGGEASIKYDRGNNTSWASGVSGGNYYLYEANTQQNAFYLEEGTQGSRGYIYGKQIATTDDIKHLYHHSITLHSTSSTIAYNFHIYSNLARAYESLNELDEWINRGNYDDCKGVPVTRFDLDGNIAGEVYGGGFLGFMSNGSRYDIVNNNGGIMESNLQLWDIYDNVSTIF